MISSEEVEEKIGYIDFKVYNTNRLDRFQLWEAADAASGDEEWLMTMFTDLFNEEIQDSSPKVLMLNMISVKPYFRNKGFGKSAMKELIQLCKVLEIDYIILKPSPIEEVDFSKEHRETRKKEIERLVSFYEQLEFDLYSLKNEEPFMVYEVS